MGDSWQDRLRDLVTQGKLRTPPNPLKGEMQTAETVRISERLKARLIEQMDNFEDLLESIRDGEWHRD